MLKAPNRVIPFYNASFVTFIYGVASKTGLKFVLGNRHDWFDSDSDANGRGSSSLIVEARWRYPIFD